MPACLKHTRQRLCERNSGSCLPTGPVNRANMYFASHKKILESLSLLSVIKNVSFHDVSFIPPWDPENVPEVAGLLCDTAAFLWYTIKETLCKTVISVHHQIWVNRITWGGINDQQCLKGTSPAFTLTKWCRQQTVSGKKPTHVLNICGSVHHA